MSTLHVACASDERYLPHAATMLCSVLAHRGDDAVHVHLLCSPRVPERATRPLEAMVRSEGADISFLRIPDEAVAELPVTEFISATMWYRIFLPDLLPGVDRLLYLDGDVIVVDDLHPLLETDLDGHHLAAVTNVFEPQYAHRPVALGLPGPHDYFNSGVLLMNLELMRRDGSARAVHDYALAHRAELVWPDQDALNVVLGARRLPLHPRWNCMNSVLLFDWSRDVFGAEAVEEARRHPAIRHFEGPQENKPWHLLCERSLSELYFAHRRRTPWPRCRRDGVTAGNLVRRARRDLSRTARRLARRARVSA